MFTRGQNSGGGMSQTLLWNNTSPTSAFPTTYVPLNNIVSNFSFSDYSYIGVEYRCSGTNNDTVMALFPSDQLVNSGDYNVNNKSRFTIGARGSSTMFYRGVGYHDTTHITITIAVTGNAAGTSETAAIPTNIYGFK